MPIDKVQRLRNLMEEFASPQDALRLAYELRIEKLRNTHVATVAPHGHVQLANWEGLEAYMNAAPSPYDALPQLLPRLHAELKVAISAKDQDQMFALLVTIAKLTKPRNLYGQ